MVELKVFNNFDEVSGIKQGKNNLVCGFKTQQSYDEMSDDFIQFDSDMSHVDLDDLFDLADSITVPEPHIINEMWSDDDKYTWQDVANCLRDNWHEIKGLVSLTDRDKMTDFAFDNYFE